MGSLCASLVIVTVFVIGMLLDVMWNRITGPSIVGWEPKDLNRSHQTIKAWQGSGQGWRHRVELDQEPSAHHRPAIRQELMEGQVMTQGERGGTETKMMPSKRHFRLQMQNAIGYIRRRHEVMVLSADKQNPSHRPPLSTRGIRPLWESRKSRNKNCSPNFLLVP
jgi:hypothetical protein